MSVVPIGQLSASLNAFHEDFLSAGKAGDPLPARQMLALARAFALLFKIAKNLEAEVAIHRLNASVDKSRGILEGASQEVMEQLVLESDGKVIRPNFRQSQSSEKDRS